MLSRVLRNVSTRQASQHQRPTTTTREFGGRTGGADESGATAADETGGPSQARRPCGHVQKTKELI